MQRKLKRLVFPRHSVVNSLTLHSLGVKLSHALVECTYQLCIKFQKVNDFGMCVWGCKFSGNLILGHFGKFSGILWNSGNMYNCT